LRNIGIEVSRSTVTRHLAEHGYRNALPLNTPMLTSDHKQKRIEWAKKHINDNWNKTLFSDETSFQLFRNTIKQWYKGATNTEGPMQNLCIGWILRKRQDILILF